MRNNFCKNTYIIFGTVTKKQICYLTLRSLSVVFKALTIVPKLMKICIPTFFSRIFQICNKKKRLGFHRNFKNCVYFWHGDGHLKLNKIYALIKDILRKTLRLLVCQLEPEISLPLIYINGSYSEYHIGGDDWDIATNMIFRIFFKCYKF